MVGTRREGRRLAHPTINKHVAEFGDHVLLIVAGAKLLWCDTVLSAHRIHERSHRAATIAWSSPSEKA